MPSQAGADRPRFDGKWLPKFLIAPTFPDAAQSRNAGTLHWVVLFTVLVVNVIVPIVAAVQPDTFGRAVRVLGVVDTLAIITLVLNSRGRTQLAAWLFIGVIIALLTFNASETGGIRSPGVQAYFIFVMLAGLLLGARAGLLVASVCSLLGLGLIAAELSGAGWLQRQEYSPVALWLLTCLYIGIALLTLRVATGTVQDALARTRAELAEREAAEARLARALDAGQLGVFEYDPKSGTFRGDPRSLQFTGLTPRADGTVLFEDWFRLVHSEDRDRVMADLNLFNDGLPHGRTHYRLTHPDGAMRHLEAAAHLTVDENGGSASILGMVMDVTDKVQAEAEREQLVRDLAERVKELRLLHEVTRLLHKASGIDESLLGELVNQVPSAWLYTDDACARISYGDIVVATPNWRMTPWHQSAAFTTSFGSGMIEVAYCNEHPPQDEGPFLAEERALINSLAELLRSHIEQRVAESQRQNLEGQLRQAQRLEALGTLAGGIAHDFNNILTAIGGHAQLSAIEVQRGTPMADSIGEIIKAHGRARDLVRRILLFSRRQEASREVMSIAPVVDEAVELLRASLPSNVEFETSVPHDLPTANADATQIHQVVMNLGTNAGYAMRERGGTLVVKLDTVVVGDVSSAPSADLASGQHLRLTVSDTGSGMSKEVQERLFEPFFTTKGQAGTGLGLSVVHGIVRDHEGAITVQSQPGVGTRFEVYLPVREGVARMMTPTANAITGNGQHIVYVDDEPSLTLVMSRMLKHLGYRCTAFTEAAAALQEFRTAPHDFDALITDLQMPKISGLELVRAFRAIRVDIPAAVATGYVAQKTEDPEAESVTWIRKPPTLPELSESLQRLLQGRRSESSA